MVLLLGCSKPNVVTKTVFQPINIPVAHRIDRPTRPVYQKSDNTASYLLKVLGYTETLEILIDENNKEADNVSVR